MEICTEPLDLSLQLPRDVHYQAIHTLSTSLPPPISDLPEDLVRRDNAAIAAVAALLPATADEARLSAACRAHPCPGWPAAAAQFWAACTVPGAGHHRRQQPRRACAGYPCHGLIGPRLPRRSSVQSDLKAPMRTATRLLRLRRARPSHHKANLRLPVCNYAFKSNPGRRTGRLSPHATVSRTTESETRTRRASLSPPRPDPGPRHGASL
jgi:hypothetical protein